MMLGTITNLICYFLGAFSGGFIAWQIWLYHDKEITRLTSRREMGVDRAANRREALKAKEGHETLDRWRWN